MPRKRTEYYAKCIYGKLMTKWMFCLLTLADFVIGSWKESEEVFARLSSQVALHVAEWKWKDKSERNRKVDNKIALLTLNYLQNPIVLRTWYFAEDIFIYIHLYFLRRLNQLY